VGGADARGYRGAMPASLVQLVVAGEGDSGGDQSAAQVGQGDVAVVDFTAPRAASWATMHRQAELRVRVGVIVGVIAVGVRHVLPAAGLKVSVQARARRRHLTNDVVPRLELSEAARRFIRASLHRPLRHRLSRR
jgi:hypothetical protein